MFQLSIIGIVYAIWLTDFCYSYGSFNWVSVIQMMTVVPRAAFSELKMSFFQQYNMVYGKLPFSHIRNPYQKICAILNPSVAIEFPTKGLENHDPMVLDVLKQCLVRDPTRRSSIGDLLKHPYLRKTTAQSGSFLSVVGSNDNDGSTEGRSRKYSEALAVFSSLTPNTKKMLFKDLDLGS